MKIYIDINHPAHVHYFRNFIKIMKSKGHSFVITNRETPIINKLLDYYQIPHHIRNKRPEKQNSLKSILYLLGMIKYCILYSFRNRPDLYMGFGASQCAITAFLFRKPCVILDDTEHNVMNHLLYKPFCSTVLTPFYFRKNLGDKQIFFNAYIEQLYLHNKYYNSDPAILNELGIDGATPYALIRYISYDATHDSKVRPIDNEFKRKLLSNISEKMPVFVSFESQVTDSFYEDYKLKISPEKIHDVIANASLLLTEGATMASEACMLGVPYIYINPLQDLGYIQEQVLQYPEIATESISLKDIETILDNKIQKIISSEYKNKIQKKIEQSTINPTDFLVWFIENYPESAKKMRKQPEFQNRFK